MIPVEIREPRVLRLKGAHAGHLLKYPFGVVLVGDGASQVPLQNERIFRDVPTALRILKVRRRDCVPAKRELERRYRLVVSRVGGTARSEPIHSYIAAAMLAGALEWQVRLDHDLVLPVEVRIEDLRTGKLEAPRMMSELGAVKDLVHAMPPGGERPNYLVSLPDGAAAIWTGSEPKEEWWQSRDLLLHHYRISEPPDVVTDHGLPTYAIVRPAPTELLVVAEPYHSLLHAGRITCWLRQQSGIHCLVHDGREVQGFDDTVVSKSDVIRITADRLETFTAEVLGGVVTLSLEQVCGAASLRAQPAQDHHTN